MSKFEKKQYFYQKIKMMVLNDSSTVPTEQILGQVLAASYKPYQLFKEEASGFGLLFEWRYYNDGKFWLCKVTKGKKTICWLSVWEGYFKLSFYFTEKNSSGISCLDVPEEWKTTFNNQKPIGKLLPFVVEIATEEVVLSAMKVMQYKLCQK